MTLQLWQLISQSVMSPHLAELAVGLAKIITVSLLENWNAVSISRRAIGSFQPHFRILLRLFFILVVNAQRDFVPWI